MQSFLPLVYGCQSYDWGKIGSDSLVYDLSHKAGILKEENPQKPFAEIWMGDHPSLPSSLKQRNGTLSSLRDLIEQEPQKFLGKAYNQFGLKRLPFLFKVLSVEKALSLQVHPSKALAKELHERRPDTYKDDNHKPEIAIAINQVEALCNFRPYEDLVQAFEEVGALRDFIGEKIVSHFMSCSAEERSEALREIIKEFFKKEEAEKNDAINRLLADISSKPQKSLRDDLVLKIQKQFPYDIGVLMSYLLNYVIAQPGEAFVMDPCEPHAYIFGNILEVMACSDNVVRGCLTPKYIDKELLVKILSCDMKNTTILRGEKLYNHKDHGFEVVKYPTKYEEFWCQRIEIDEKGKETCTFKFEYPSISIVLKGTGIVLVKAPHATTFEEHQLKEGESVFFLPESEIKFSTEEGGFMAYLSTSQSLEK